MKSSPATDAKMPALAPRRLPEGMMAPKLRDWARPCPNCASSVVISMKTEHLANAPYYYYPKCACGCVLEFMCTERKRKHDIVRKMEIVVKVVKPTRYWGMREQERRQASVISEHPAIQSKVPTEIAESMYDESE